MSATSIAARARVVPLAVLLTLVAMALVVRWRAHAPKHPPTNVAPAPSSAETAPSAAPSASTVLRGALPEKPALVAEHTTRMIHADVRHTNRARGKLPKRANVVWTYSVGGAIEAQVTSSPDEQTLYVASLDGSLTAITRAGQKKWSVALGDRVYSTPCVADDGTIYVGSDNKRFHAITPEGRIKWRLETQGDADTGAAITKDGLVVFAAGTTVYAARENGSVAWRFAAKRKVFTSPAIADDGGVVFGAQDHNVYALKPNGQLAWSTDVGADVDGAPAIADDGSIAVGTDGNDIVKLSRDGAIVWRAPMGGFVRGALSVARNGDVLAGVYGPSPRQARVRGDDGSIVGSFAVPGTGAREFGVHGGALEDDDGALAFGAQDDAVYVIDTSGALRFRFVTGGDVDAPLTLLSDGSLVAASDDGKVYLFQASE